MYFSDLRVHNDVIFVRIANIFAGMVFLRVRCMTGARLAPSSDDMFAARRAQTDLQFSPCVTSFDHCTIRRRVFTGNCESSCSTCISKGWPCGTFQFLVPAPKLSAPLPPSPHLTCLLLFTCLAFLHLAPTHSDLLRFDE